MARNKFLSFALLYPLSRLYGCIVAVRNMMFNRGIFLKQHEPEIPVIVVGNISVGGAGKTPHTEYIVSHLCRSYKIAVLSRGYKRKTKGFVLASPNSHVDDIGDESYQIYQKFRNHGVTVAVCENRVKGISEIHRLKPDVELVVLDDAFQHRYVKPTVSVVLMEYNRPAFNDHLLPFGRLREPISALNRADIVVVTKCPEEMKPMETRIFKTKLNLFPYQKLFFSGYKYLPLEPVFPGEVSQSTLVRITDLTQNDAILSITGVANPKPFIMHLKSYNAKVRIKRYSDHHRFTHADMQSIFEKFNTMSGNRKIIITTEKDAVRLKSNPYFPPELRAATYYMPISVAFGEEFNEMVLEKTIQQKLPRIRHIDENVLTF